jgi:hypothetical protein
MNKQHHNPYYKCPLCQGDNVALCPPAMGESGMYVCLDCVKQIKPVVKEKQQ